MEKPEPSTQSYGQTQKGGETVPVTHSINAPYAEMFPQNCPVNEYTADGMPVGVCTFYLPDGKTCPRHGVVK
jgi:hypothetical protein